MWRQRLSKDNRWFGYLGGCRLEFRPIDLLQQLEADLLHVDGALAYVQAARVAHQSDKKIYALDDRLARRASLRDGLSNLIYEGDVTDNRQMCFEQRGLGGCHLPREHRLDPQPDRTDRTHYPLLFKSRVLLLFMIKLVGQTDAADDHNSPLTNTTTDGKTEVTAHVGVLQRTRQCSASAVGHNFHNRLIASGEITFDETTHCLPGGILVRAMNANEAFITISDVGSNDCKHAFDICDRAGALVDERTL